MIAGGGFALMACRLAEQRTGSGLGLTSGIDPGPVDRETVRLHPGVYPASAEYYRIIDKADTAFRNDAAWHGCGLRVYL